MNKSLHKGMGIGDRIRGEGAMFGEQQDLEHNLTRMALCCINA